MPALLAALLIAFAAAGSLHAQTPVLHGTVTDGVGTPVEGVVVVLHRVSDGAGEEVDRATTDADGRFELELGPSREGVYFAATRYRDSLYVGGLFRDLAEIGGEYRITVGGAGIGAFGTGLAAAEPPPSSQWERWTIGLLFGAVGLAGILLPIRRARRPAGVRDILVELAELEESQADREGEGVEEYRSRRDALRSRLREMSLAAVPDGAGHD